MAARFMDHLPEILLVIAIAWSVITIGIMIAAIIGRGLIGRWRYVVAVALWIAWVMVR